MKRTLILALISIFISLLYIINIDNIVYSDLPLCLKVLLLK